jgi:hypothetical protein
MGKTFKEMRSGHGKLNKKHPHKDSRHWKDESHERDKFDRNREKNRRG